MSDNSPVLLALDWGTSSLRACLLGADGRVLDRRDRPWGILQLPGGGFPAAFAAITEGWRDADRPMIASGMVGSRNGWHEVPYLDLPLDAPRLAAALHPLPVEGGVLHLVPGLRDPNRPDVMRGEETEALGAIERLGRPPGPLALVMPGTHSKWLWLERGAVRRFRTFMTGELFAVLGRHSILAVPGAAAAQDDAPDGAPDEASDAGTAAAAFRSGVERGSRGGLGGELFSARALVLAGRLAPERVPDHLSGLLLGDELARGLAELPVADAPVVLVAAPALAARYAAALRVLDRPEPVRLADASMLGLHRLAAAAGLSPIAAAGNAPPP